MSRGIDVLTYAAAKGYTDKKVSEGGGGFDPYSEARDYSDVYIPDGTNYADNNTSVVISPQNLSAATAIQNRSVNILGKAANYAECVQIGYQASVYGTESIAIGDADAAANSVSIGRLAGSSSAKYSVSIGERAANSGQNSTTVGYRASGSNSYAGTAIGANATNGIHSYSVALGAYSKNGRGSEVSVGSGGSDTPRTRLIANVTDPALPQDAATKNYVDQRLLAGGTTAPTTATVGEVGTLYAYVSGTTGHLAICTEIDTTDPDNPSYTWSTLV